MGCQACKSHMTPHIIRTVAYQKIASQKNTNGAETSTRCLPVRVIMPLCFS